MTRKAFHVAAVIAALGAAPVAFAQSSSSSSGGVGSGTSSSPGVSQHNDSQTGVALPGDAPVDARTHQPAQIGTASTTASSETPANHEGTGAGAPAYTDLTQGSSSSQSE